MTLGGIKYSLVGNNKVQGKDCFYFITQNKVLTIRVAPPQSLTAGKFVDGERKVKVSAGKGNMRSCIAP